MHASRNFDHSYFLPHPLPSINKHKLFYSTHKKLSHFKKPLIDPSSIYLSHTIKALFTINNQYDTNKHFLRSLHRTYPTFTRTRHKHKNNYRSLISHLRKRIHSLNHTNALTILWCLSKMMALQRHKNIIKFHIKQTHHLQPSYTEPSVTKQNISLTYSFQNSGFLPYTPVMIVYKETLYLPLT